MATSKGSNVVKLASSKETAPAKAKKAKTAKTAPAKKSFEASVIMKLRKDTKGAFVYEAVDSKGNSIPQDDTIMPSVYFRKSQMPNSPEFVEVTIKGIASLSAKPKRVEADEGEED